MAKLKKSSPSNTERGSRRLAVTKERHSFPHRIKLPTNSYRNQFDLVEPQISAEGVHTWSFEAPCPVDVLFLTVDDRHPVRMNRHGYFEVLFLCSGSANCHIQDRRLPFNEGDLAVTGAALGVSGRGRTASAPRRHRLILQSHRYLLIPEIQRTGNRLSRVSANFPYLQPRDQGGRQPLDQGASERAGLKPR
jgi:hypothetical protein